MTMKHTDFNKITTEEFIQRARKVHGNKYDYSKSKYVNSKTKTTIICPIHGEFQQTPIDVLPRLKHVGFLVGSGVF